MKKTTTILTLLLMAGSAGLCRGQSVIELESGARHECTVLEYNDGVFHVQLKNGKVRKVRGDQIARILFEIPTPEEPPPPDGLPEEFGLQDVPKPPGSTPEQPKPQKKTPTLKLASNWQARLAGDANSLGDTVRLLSKCGTPQIDLQGTNITLWNGVTYLMPLQKAKQTLHLGPSSKDSITCPAFPPRSFFSHAFKGNFEDGFDQLYLITDIRDQVVGVQLQDNVSRKERWFQYSDSYSAEWSLYNFVQDRKKANPNWLAGFYVCNGPTVVRGHPPRGAPITIETGVPEGVVRVDSELFSINRNRWNLLEDDKSRSRIRLLLARPVVDLMLYVAQNSR